MAKSKAVAVVKAQPSTDAGSLMVLINRAASDPTFDVAKLGALLEVKERWEKEEARRAFVVALNKFKAAPPALTKNKQVKFDATEYWHATLDQVSQVIGKSLAAVGISHRWDVAQDDGKITVICILTHDQGHSERVPMSAAADTSGKKNGIQAIGSTVTYLQRYTLLAATGMAVKGQDDDGAKAEGMDEKVRLDFGSAIDAQADAEALATLWKAIAVECRKTPKDMESYNALKALVTAKGKQLKAAAKGAK